MKNILNYTLDELKDIFLKDGIKTSKALFTFKSLYRDRNLNLKEIPFVDTEYLKNTFSVQLPKVIKTVKNEDTFKFLIELYDGNHVESVVMKHSFGNSICISTQVGCNMGCKFCQSGRIKKVRNLETHEMIGQIICASNELNEKTERVVLMGIGEPFDNYDNVIKFIKIINDDNGMGIAKKHITVSTCGIIPKIYDFIDSKVNVNLAISLHAPNDIIRSAIMPVNKKYPLNELIKAVKTYNRRISFEYLMLNDINDSIECANELSNLLNGINGYVNLIPYNETENINLSKSGKEKIALFFDTLKQNDILVTVRHEFGGDLKAACGQLYTENFKD